MTLEVSVKLDVVTTDDQDFVFVLKEKAEIVQFPLSKADLELVDAMQEKLYQLGGVGLAAPQVNQQKQIIAVCISEIAARIRNNAKPYPMHILINPSYEGVEQDGLDQDFESCFSINDRSGKVPRYNSIKLTYQDLDGKKYTETARGFYARVLQHEIDHINGVLITDRLTPDCVQGSIKEMMEIRRNELTEEQRVYFDELTK